MEIPELEEETMVSFCMLIFSLLTSQTDVFVFVDVLEHLGPVVGGGDLEVGFLSCIVSSKDAVMGLARGCFPVFLWQVEGSPGVIEVQEPYPHHFVFSCKALFVSIWK
jgi:hypothetical protein